MSAVQDIIALENGEGTDDEQFAAMQRVINEGSGWRMQGSMGRSMMAAIEGGWCMLGREPTTDYWGNRIPSRTEVKPGTKGSRAFVAEECGEEWAAKMEAL